jgi:hypothetical protein
MIVNARIHSAAVLILDWPLASGSSWPGYIPSPLVGY